MGLLLNMSVRNDSSGGEAVNSYESGPSECSHGTTGTSGRIFDLNAIYLTCYTGTVQGYSDYAMQLASCVPVGRGTG